MERLRALVYDKHITNIANLSQITGRFNSNYEGKSLIILNETSAISHVKDCHDRFNQLKSVITDPEQTIELKCKNIGDSVPCYANFCIISNHDHCVNVENGDRR